MHSNSIFSLRKLGLLVATATLSTPLLISTANAADATANATATVVEAITLTKATGGDLIFGAVVAGSTSGTLVIGTDNSATASGGVTKTSEITQSAADFTVDGADNYAYTVTLPTSATLTHTDGVTTMTVNTFTENADELLGTTAETFQVGATLNVGASQTKGDYSGTFTVSVVYQ